MNRQSNRVAMIFSHHPHEIFATGLLLEHRADLLFLSHSHREKRLDGQVLAGLDAIGFEGTVRFLPISESTAYSKMLEHDHAWFRSIRDQVAGWLGEVQPAMIFADAYESYNPIHDMCSLMVDAGLASAPFKPDKPVPERFGIPLAFLSRPGAILSDTDSTGKPLLKHELTGHQIRMKRKRCDLLLRESLPDGTVADHPADVIGGFHPDLYECEFYQPIAVGRNYSNPPEAGDWKTFDEHGRERVAAGRFAKAISFDGHFAPMARAMFREDHSVNGDKEAA